MARVLVLSGARIRFGQPCGSPNAKTTALLGEQAEAANPLLGRDDAELNFLALGQYTSQVTQQNTHRRAMGARRIFEGVALPPDVMRTAVTAFNALWLELVDCFDAQSQDTARETLAEAVISALQERPNFLDNIRTDAMRTMAVAFPERLRTSAPTKGLFVQSTAGWKDER